MSAAPTTPLVVELVVVGADPASAAVIERAAAILGGGIATHAAPTADSARALLTRLAGGAQRAVILDLDDRTGDTRFLLPQLRSRGDWGVHAIIAISSSLKESDAVAAAGNGGVLLAKPLTEAAVEAALREVLHATAHPEHSEATPVAHSAPVAPSRARRVGTTLFLWGTLGFFVGTLVLLGPVRWLTAWMRSRELSDSLESLAVKAVIALLLAGTGYLAVIAARFMFRLAPGRRVVVPVAATVLAALAVAVWLNPASLSQPVDTSDPLEFRLPSGARFAFGPYPTEEVMRGVSSGGYTAVVSLLHPAVVPFEPKLISDEEEVAARLGVRLIHLPMLPWVSKNTESLDSLRVLAGQSGGRYYIHCYLGRDRVSVARRLLQSVGAVGGSAQNAPNLADVTTFERGAVRLLGDSIYLGPLPSDEEFFAYILGGTVRTVVSLQSLSDSASAALIAQERAQLGRFAIPLVLAPLDPLTPDAVVSAVRAARSARRPVYVHAFRSDSPEAAAFAEEFARTAAPAVPAPRSP